MDCTIENKKQVPLSSAVKASIVDKYGDIGVLEQRYSHWASRELKQLYFQVLPKIKHKVTITVNRNTHTATLPLDFMEETFIGGIDACWHKVPLKLNTKLVDSKNILAVECEDKCTKCGQDTGICNDLVVTEVTNLIVINNSTYEETVIKKLYPNGDYYLETNTPYWDIQTSAVIYPPAPRREFIAAFDLKPCGCLDTTADNIATLQNYCPDIYCNYYAPCDTACNVNYGGYKIFEESGLIQFGTNFPYEKVYVEYNGFIQKIRGQYYVPQVAFETLVEAIKYRAIKDKDNVPRWKILDKKEDYRIAKADMLKVTGRASLARLIQSIALLPKFDIDYSHDWYSCFSNGSGTSTLTTVSGVTTTITTDTTTGECCITNPTTIINRTSFVLSVRAGDGIGHPTPGEPSYQNNVLIDALDIKYIIVAHAVETLIDGNFTFDAATGTINRAPNIWITGDSLIVHYNKNL